MVAVATLTLKENAQQKFCKVRPLPYALKERVEKKNGAT